MEKEWNCIMEKAYKIDNIADKLKWDELSDVVADAVDNASREKDVEKLFFSIYQFLFRLHQRVRKMESKSPFNIVYRDNRLIDHHNVKCYRVINYDYKMFLYCKKKGCEDSITNDWFLIPETALTEQERISFEKKCENA